MTAIPAELLAEAEAADREQWGVDGPGEGAPADVADEVAHRLGVIAGLGAEHDSLAALADLAGALRDRMLDRWPALRPPPTARPD